MRISDYVHITTYDILGTKARIHQLLATSGLSCTEISRRMGKPDAYVARFVRRCVATLKTANAIADALDCHITVRVDLYKDRT